MKFRSILVVVLLSSSILFAQSADISQVAPLSQNPGNSEIAVLTGKLVSDAGTPVDSSANVVLACGDQIRAHDYSDAHGNFSLSVYVSQDPLPIPNTAHPWDQAPVFQNWSGCELYAEIAGFRSERLHLTDRPDAGNTNVGTITVHQVNVSADDPRFTVSVNSLAAPDKARKAFDKGEEAERKGKWEQACDYFKRAVQVYPRYAIAWLELGRLQLRQNSLLDAQQSFRHAVDEDSKLVDGYVELARVAAAQQNWQGLAAASDTLIQRWPDSSSEYWFFDSLAYYNLGNLDQAETSVTRGLRLDSQHQYPQLEYLCGLILGAKKDYKAGAEHIGNYLHLSPNSPIADIAKKAMAAYQHRALLEADEQR